MINNVYFFESIYSSFKRHTQIRLCYVAKMQNFSKVSLTSLYAYITDKE